MNKLFRNYLFLLIPVLAMLVVSCKDDEDPGVVAPQITSVSPTQGLPGSTVTITGTNLANATAVTIGGETASTSANTNTSITATVPTDATPGETQIRVTTAGGSDTADFTVLEDTDPGDETTITSVSPATGGAGTEVTITGTNFTGATGLMIGETEVAAEDFEVSEDGNTITFTIPDDAAEGDYTGTITVTNAAGEDVTSADDVTFTFTPGDTGGATITGVSPTAVGPGSTVTITGTNLTGITGLRIGEDTELTEEDYEVSEDGTTITFTVPEDATEGYTGGFTITTADGEEVAGPEDVTLTFNMSAPVVTEIEPAEMTGDVGSVVTITGMNFTDATVFFVGADGTEVEADVEDTSTPETLIFTVPEGAQTGPITIRTTVEGEEFEVQTGTFTIGDGQTGEEATITGASPMMGGPGSTVTLTGTNLTGITGITIGETTLTEDDFEVDEAGENVTFTIPEDAAEGDYTGPFTVTTADGTEVAGPEDVTFTYSPSGPGVTSVDPEEMTGAVGSVVTITGMNFTDATVFFVGANDTEVQAEVEATSTPEELIVTVPEGAQTGPITIRTTVEDEEYETQTGTFTVE